MWVMTKIMLKNVLRGGARGLSGGVMTRLKRWRTGAGVGWGDGGLDEDQG